MNKNQWLNARKKGIGGTDISAILGLSPFKTAYDVFLDKTNQSVAQEENISMKIGTLLEPVVANIYEQETKRTLKECGLIVHPKYDFIIGSPDRLINNEDVGLEIKTTGFFDSKEWGGKGTDAIPQHYYMQVAWYMMLTELPCFDVAALGSGREFRIYTVYRDIELERMLLENAIEFWEKHIVANSPPEISEQDNPNKYYKNSIKNSIIASESDITICSHLSIIKKEIKALEAKETELTRALQLSLKENDTLLSTDGSTLATWKTQEQNRLNTKKLKESGIDLTNFYDKTTVRKFLLK